jgi:hypothetical protein
MPDPLPSGPRPTSAPGAAGEDARIEQLLVTGLDHYFAGEFDTAIAVWTRVLFLDRTHDRARAYIERARSAQAEQQRSTEALVHQGLHAFDRGEVEEARAILRDALARGASGDMALGVLHRIDRLGVVPLAPARQPVSAAADRRARVASRARLEPVEPRWSSPGTLVLAVVVLIAAIWSVRMATRADLATPVGSSGVARTVEPAPAALPMPAPTDVYLTRAQRFFESGRLYDALAALERVPLGDARRSDADRLRAQIQRELLNLASFEAQPAAAPPRE